MTILQDLKFMYDASKQFAESISRDIADKEKDPRSMCFWNICNRIKITEEIMTFYERSWGSRDFPEVDEETEPELVDRVMTITKDMFIDIVSAIEKSAKDTAGLYKNSGIKEDALSKSSHLYIWNVLDSSRKKGIIDGDAFTEWDSILTMRNLAMHNNSVSDRNKKYAIGGINISMRQGRMMKGPLNTFVVLSDRVIELFYEWLQKLDAKY